MKTILHDNPMTPTITLFKKEFSQHGAFAFAMVCMCLLFQVAYYTMTLWTGLPLASGGFLIVALIVTALYAGGATALAYSTEHADGTYILLRKMPISLATIAGGKIGWALCGTVLVLLGNMLLSAGWFASIGDGGVDAHGIWLTWGIAIAEAFVWGLFWSTRCRTQVNALLVGYGCASVTAFGVACLVSYHSSNSDVMSIYTAAASYRCAAVVVVGLLALWGAFRWFDWDVKSAVASRFSLQEIRLLRYPKRIKSPFMGLVHHHIRHASLIYHFGIFCMVAWAVVTFVFCVVPFYAILNIYSGYAVQEFFRDFQWCGFSGVFLNTVGIVIFWTLYFGVIRRHRRAVFHFGMFCTMTWVLVMLFLGSLHCSQYFSHELHLFQITLQKVLEEYRGFWDSAAIVCITGMVLFWATIFGHDQKNDSYRFLSRLGIPEGQVWWSRMLPAMFFYTPVIAFFAGYCLWLLLSYTRYSYYWDFLQGGYHPANLRVLFVLQMSTAVWLAPMAIGAFLSVSFRSQMVAIALTVAGTLTMLGWAYLWHVLFGASPLWTTVPICVALLVASRIRAGYWLRETFSWRSRLIPLAPVLATTLAVMIALPFVRIYSVPYVSWEQIDAYFDQADPNLLRNPAKRKALLWYIAEHNAVPEEYKDVYTRLRKSWFEMEDIGGCTYEEFLLLFYVHARDGLITNHVAFGMEDKLLTFHSTRFTPWETVRIDRSLRLQLIGWLVQNGGLRDKNAEVIRDFCRSQSEYRGHSVFDQPVWGEWQWSFPNYIERHLCDKQTRKVVTALDKWYTTHQALPESLDELVGTYLEELPVHPFTKQGVEYRRNAPPPELYVRDRWYDISVRVLGRPSDAKHDGQEWQTHTAAFRKSGGTYLRLGRNIVILIEEPEGATQ